MKQIDFLGQLHPFYFLGAFEFYFFLGVGCSYRMPTWDACLAIPSVSLDP